jgi:hypothetical protein
MNQTEISFDTLFGVDEVNTYHGVVYLSSNNKKKYEKEFKKIIKLKKDETLLIELTRKYDLLSDFTFEYEKGDEINFGEIKELPSDLNQIIKEYLIPKCNIDIFISSDFGNLKSAEFVNDNKNIVQKKINLNMENLGQSFLSYVSNHLPIVAIQFSRLYLKIISNKDTDLNFKCTGTLLNNELRVSVACGKYLYYGESKTTILNGLIANRY